MAPRASFPNSTDNQVEVVNGTDGNPQAKKDVTPVDEILEPTATYTTPDGSAQGKLVVTAKSSDQFGGDNVVLSVDNPVDGSARRPRRHRQRDADRPADRRRRTVTITSSKGGTLDVPVHLDVNGVADATRRSPRTRARTSAPRPARR